MMKIPYTFSVLRYVHDPVTQEFVNIGVALFSKQARYLNARCAANYGRITKTFGKIDGYRFRQATRYIQDQLQEVGEQFSRALPFESATNIETMLSRVLPSDDSAFQFSPSGGGISADLDRTLTALFGQFVEKYSLPESSQRDDDEVWKVYREPLERRSVIPYLNPKKIITPDYEYEFQHSWKNEHWHVYEPVSFDLVEPTSILDKANRWLGRATNLADSKEKFKMYMLLGEPKGEGLGNAFLKAQNILHKMPCKPEFIKESEAEGFAEELASEISAHSRRSGDPR